jgi:hypothetical protein
MTALLLAWLMASPLAAAAQASGGYRIAGVVVNAASGQPVAGARVTIAPAARPGERVSAVGGDDGRFAFTGLPRGKYELAGQRRGLLAGGWSGAIIAGPGQDTESIVLRLSPPGIISGKVVDDAGEPVAQGLVELLGSRIIDGRRQLTKDSFKRTDDTGEYRFSSLPAGSYYLVVSGVPWYTGFNETMGDSAPRSMTHAGYGIRYHPNAGDPAAAEPLILTAGQEATSNFTLLPVPAVSVYVHCGQHEELTKQYTLTAPGLPGNPVSVRQGSGTGDLYNLWGVPPGHYTLRAEATDGSRTWYGTNEFDVAAADMDVGVTLREASSLSGAVVPESGGSLPAQFTVVLRDETGRSQPLAMGAGGRFSIPAIPPGRYRVGFSGADDYYLQSWSAEGGRREGEMLDIPAGAAVRLTLSAARGVGRIAGSVYRDGQPLPGALVVLSPANRAMPSNSDGSYEFRGLPPGEYALFAVEDGADLEYANPAALRPYLSGAKKVLVSRGDSDKVGQAVSPAFPKPLQ